MRTKEGLPIGVSNTWGSVQLVLGSTGHLLDAETALRLGHALFEASGGPPATAFVRSVVSRQGASITVDREPLGTGVRLVIGRPAPSHAQLPGSSPVRRGDAPEPGPELVVDLPAADAGELALELLRTAAGLPRQLTFAAWTDGAWLSERRRRGDLEAAMVAALRAATANAAAARELWERIGALLGGPARVALPAGDATSRADVDELAERLGELGVPKAFVRGLGDALFELPADERCRGAELYDAGRQVCDSIIEVARRRGDR